jgi:hypothetical protein
VIRAVGVVVPAHNEESLLPSCLASVRTRALTVITSARRENRVPHGFSEYLAELDAASA